MASDALIKCKRCVFRHARETSIFMVMLIKSHAGKDESSDGRTHAARWALAGLSLSMLMPSLDTSIANVGLPTLARAFDASFQQVQWIVLSYLLAITTLI